MAKLLPPADRPFLVKGFQMTPHGLHPTEKIVHAMSPKIAMLTSSLFHVKVWEEETKTWWVEDRSMIAYPEGKQLSKYGRGIDV